MQPRCTQTARLRSAMPTGNIPEAPELGHLAMTDKMLVPNGVRYRGVPLYMLQHLML